MAEIVFLIEEAPEGGYTARGLGYSIYTEADTWDELKLAIQDALSCHFDEKKWSGQILDFSGLLADSER